jgi:Glycine/D-amino acid oxidases (deaminating)
MSESPDVIVVGGGIVGLCTALAAADRGLNVTVIDDAQPAAASRASAGMLGACLPGLPPSLRNIAFAARDLYPEFVAALAERSGIEIMLDRSGILEIAATPDELDALRVRIAGGKFLDQLALAELEPALGVHAGAVHHPLDGWVDNRAVMEALSIGAFRATTLKVERDRATSFEFATADARVTLVGGRRVSSARVVLASGAWTALGGLPRQVPVRPVKGELLTLDRCPLRHVVYGARGYIVPRDGTALVGATSEDPSFDPTPTGDGRDCLLGAGAALVPSLSGANVVKHWGGVRPVSPDGVPILGEDPIEPVLVYACGFSRNGILLAPWAGRVLAKILAGDADTGFPEEFRPERFG